MHPTLADEIVDRSKIPRWSSYQEESIPALMKAMIFISTVARIDC